jgi:hypothetical protein
LNLGIRGDVGTSPRWNLQSLILDPKSVQFIVQFLMVRCRFKSEAIEIVLQSLEILLMIRAGRL